MKIRSISMYSIGISEKIGEATWTARLGLIYARIQYQILLNQVFVAELSTSSGGVSLRSRFQTTANGYT